METKRLKRLPVGIQTFSNIIEDDMLYIDKTEYIWNMIPLCGLPIGKVGINFDSEKRTIGEWVIEK